MILPSQVHSDARQVSADWTFAAFIFIQTNVQTETSCIFCPDPAIFDPFFTEGQVLFVLHEVICAPARITHSQIVWWRSDRQIYATRNNSACICGVAMNDGHLSGTRGLPENRRGTCLQIMRHGFDSLIVAVGEIFSDSLFTVPWILRLRELFVKKTCELSTESPFFGHEILQRASSFRCSRRVSPCPDSVPGRGSGSCTAVLLIMRHPLRTAEGLEVLAGLGIIDEEDRFFSWCCAVQYAPRAQDGQWAAQAGQVVDFAQERGARRKREQCAQSSRPVRFRSSTFCLRLAMARAGFSPLGQVRVQFMMVWHR